MGTQAMGDLTTYDPYFENHVSFVTEDLDYYTKAFDADSVPYYASSFTDPETQVVYKSVLFQTPGSLAPGAKSLLNMQILGTPSTTASVGSSSVSIAVRTRLKVEFKCEDCFSVFILVTWPMCGHV